ncbi:MAG: HAMP domain-containing sensor histidine kinase [Solibacillus sp.]
MRQFLLGKSITIGFLLIVYVFTISFLFVLQLPIVTVRTVAATYAVLFVGWLTVSYLSERRKLQHVEQLVKALEEPYLLGEVLPKPTSMTEQNYFTIVQAISHDAISRVERANRQSRDYKEYVEHWIHELKTPLTAMSLMLASEPDVRKLRRELKRADNLTDSILHYARLQTIETDKQLADVDMQALINRTVKNQMDILIASKIQVEISGNLTVYSDQKALQFIVNQFLINSAKYCPGSKVTIHASAHQLIYEDNGIGIPAHEIARIFERGYTGTNGRTLGTSTGMGLYIVAKLCEELHITLQVKSQRGRFTRFELTFPNLTKM